MTNEEEAYQPSLKICEGLTKQRVGSPIEGVPLEGLEKLELGQLLG
jgi:hypothetical protein